jgi:hypothetical protein
MRFKRIGLSLFIISTILCTTGCNKQVFDFNYTFDRAIIDTGNEVIEVEIDKWNDYDNSDQIQIIAKDGTVYLVHSSKCILIKD